MEYLNKNFWQMLAGLVLTLTIALLVLYSIRVFNQDNNQPPTGNYIANPGDQSVDKNE